MRAVCYPRVSSDAQRERDTIESQLQVLPAFVASHGWQLVRPVETYVDDGRTAKAGHLDQRRGFSALLRDAAAGVFDVVVVVDLDRLTRSEDLTERGAILGAFQRAGVKIAVAGTGQVLDLSTSMGDLYASLQAFFAAEENRKRSERVIRGKLAAAQRGGKTTGRGPYGLVFEKPNRWLVDPVTGPIAREIVERVAGGESCYAIADDLNRRGIRGPGWNETWHRGRVYDLVRSRHVAGEYTAHRATRTVVAVPAIVDEETWQRAQDVLAANRKAPLRKTKYVYLLEGLARCGLCGGRMLVQSGCLAKGKFPRPAVYICEHRKNRKMGPERCAAPKVRVDDVDPRAWAAICRELDDPALPAELAAESRRIASDARDWEADAAGYRAHLARLDQVGERLLERYRRGLVTEAMLDKELAAQRRERAAVRAQLATAERAGGDRKSARTRASEAVASIERLRSAMAAATPAEQREIVTTLVDPGGVTFNDVAIRVELFVPRPATASDRSGALVDARSCSADHERKLRIRLVA